MWTEPNETLRRLSECRRQEAHSPLSSLQTVKLTSHSIQYVILSAHLQESKRERKGEKDADCGSRSCNADRGQPHTRSCIISEMWHLLDFQPEEEEEEEEEEEDLSLSREFKILPAAAALVTGIRVCQPCRRC